jgi:hypothetical protein
MGAQSRQRHKAKQKTAKQKTAKRQQHQPGHGQPHAGPSPFGVGVPRQAARSAAEQAPAMVVAAVRARSDNDQDEFERLCDLLVVGPGGADGHAVVERALFDILLAAVDSIWAAGWQPVELHRLVTRRGGAALGGVLIDVMAARMRGYAAGTVDERWEAQLRTLAVEVWWRRDDHYFEELSGAARADRSSAIRTGLELLVALNTVPRIPALIPLPGKARRGSLAADPRREVDQRMLERVRGLLAKAESTTFEAEAETYTAKAQELMARHSIDYAVLAAQTGARDEPVARRIGIDNPYESEKVTLLNAVAGANRSRSVWSQQLGFVTVFGFANDLDSIEVLFTSLLVQATRAMTQAGQHRDALGRSRTRSFRQSFLTGFAHRIGHRLMQATESATDEAAAEGGSDLLPVLASRDEQVRETLHAAFPEVVLSRTRRVSNAAGWHSGIAAADRASLQVHEALPT